MNHQANVRHACGVIIAVVAIVVFAASCTSRVVYDGPVSAEITADAININTATADQLAALPHIGPKTAENIIRFTSENGPFRRPEELMQIRGISEKRFLAIRPLIRTE